MIWSKEFPHLYQIFKLSDISHPDNFFAGMDSERKSQLAMESYRKWENRLSRLSVDAFNDLSVRASQCVTKRDKKNNRHWSTLFEVLNEAKGYEFLLDEGYNVVRFIPTQKKEVTPDIWAKKNDSEAVLEVKTIWRSDFDLSLRFEKVQTSICEISDGFKNKIIDDYEEAKRQCYSIKDPNITRRICYFCIDLDLVVAMEESNQKLLEDFMKNIEKSDVEIVYDSRTWS
ncbi:MAG: hypothetical protein JW787_04045 [Sedimentisphaerales bacterium]|nr:hypothetical protein [Sedimentisphaerales bacterium]